MTTQIQGMEAQLASIEERDLKPEIEKITNDIRNMGDQKYEIEEEIRTLHNEKESKRMEIKGMYCALSNLLSRYGDNIAP